MADENQIEHCAQKLAKKGYSNCIVYRNQVEEALSTVALSSTRLSDSFNKVVSRSRDWCVIGFRDAEDELKIRRKVRDLKKAAGLTGGAA